MFQISLIKKMAYTYMEMDENGIVQYSNNPVIVQGQKILSELPKKKDML